MRIIQVKNREQFNFFCKRFYRIQSNTKLFLVIFSFLFFNLSPNLLAQTAETIKVSKGNKTLIKVPIIVSDRDGRRIPGLKKEDFSLFQAEIKQNIDTFASEDEPISVALLIDTSRSTQGFLDNIKEAANDFIEILNPNDQCLIVTFDSQVRVMNQLTSDRKTLKNALKEIQTGEKEGTVVFDSIDQIVKSSFSGANGRKAVVILSDGKDLGSGISKVELLNELQESDLSIYAIYYQSGAGFNKPVIDSSGTVEETKPTEKPKKVKKPKVRKKGYTIMIPLPGETFTQEEVKLIDQAMTTDALKSLKDLTDLTAGRLYMSDAEKLSLIFKQVAGELRQVYLLGFEGSADNPALQQITVKVDRPGVVVNTRHKIITK
jgi:VWFA-related protein